MKESDQVQRDMTQGKIAKQIFLFALPLMAGNFLQIFYNLVDGVVVSNFVNPTLPTAFSSVNVSTPLTMLFVAIAMGMSIGTGIMVSQYFGARQYEDLRKTVSTSMIFLIAVSVALSLTGWFFCRSMLKGLLKLEDGAMLDGAVDYLSIYCLGLVFQFAYNVIASILRGIGNSRATLYFLLVSTLLNIVLDLVFVLVFGWGIAGTATATVISQAASAFTAFAYMYKKYPLLRFKRSEFKLDAGKLKTAIRMSLPATVQQCILSLSFISMQRLVISFGQETIDSFGAVTRVQEFTLIPARSLHVGLLNFTGQNVGAGQIGRVKRGHWLTVLMAICICIGISVLLYVLTGPLLHMFNLSGETFLRGHSQLRFVVWVLWILGLLFISYGVLQGSGDVVYPTVASMTALILRVVFAYIAARYTSFGWRSVYIAHPISTVLALFITFGRYFSMKWVDKAIAKKKADPQEDEAESVAAD
ncbi:MAG: MATE family efflux transporter [Oscillospiraceae bacterium]|jgi:putative MATE family efflux protein